MSLRSGEVADLAGVNVETLRYYERRGLIPSPPRTLGGHRVYDDEIVDLLGVIKASQRLGFTIDEVAALLEAGRRPHLTPSLRERALEKVAEINRRIDDLLSIRTALERVIDAECENLTGCTCPDCPIPFAEVSRPTH